MLVGAVIIGKSTNPIKIVNSLDQTGVFSRKKLSTLKQKSIDLCVIWRKKYH